jgi:hypothetical protein
LPTLTSGFDAAQKPLFPLARGRSVVIDPLHSVLERKVIRFAFGAEDFIKTITM